jgi:hypothetical protein
MMDEGMENKQAVAACMSMFKEKKGLISLQKAISLDEKRNQITMAFQNQFSPNADKMCWVVDIYDADGYLITEDQNKYYQVGYSLMDGKYVFPRAASGRR